MKYIRLTKEEKDYIRTYGNTKSCTEIAEWIGCCITTVIYYRRKYNTGKRSIEWTDEKSRKVEELWNAGYSCKELAIHFNCTVDAINARIHILRKGNKYNLPRRRQRDGCR